MIVPGSRTSLNFNRRWEANIRLVQEGEAPAGRPRSSRLVSRLTKLFGGPVQSAEKLLTPDPPAREAVDPGRV